MNWKYWDVCTVCCFMMESWMNYIISAFQPSLVKNSSLIFLESFGTCLSICMIEIDQWRQTELWERCQSRRMTYTNTTAKTSGSPSCQWMQTLKSRWYNWEIISPEWSIIHISVATLWRAFFRSFYVSRYCTQHCGLSQFISIRSGECTSSDSHSHVFFPFVFCTLGSPVYLLPDILLIAYF